MEKEIENIIKSKRFLELSENERELIREWASSEDEFNQLKSVFVATDVFKNEQIKQLNPTIKQRLDVRFKEKYDKQRLVWYNKLWLFLWPEDANILKKPLLQLAAVGLIVLLATPFLFQNNSSQKRLAVNDKPFEEKQEEINESIKNVKELEEKVDQPLIDSENEMEAVDKLEDAKDVTTKDNTVDYERRDVFEEHPVMQSPSEGTVYEMSDEVVELQVLEDRGERLNEEPMMKSAESDQDQALFAGASNQRVRADDKYDSSKDSQFDKAGYATTKKVDPAKTIDLLTALY